MSQAEARLPRRRSAAAAALAMLLVVAAAFSGPAAQAATTVYRSVDAEGRVIFSDTPPAPGESAEAVEIADPDSFEAPAAPASGAPAETWDWDMTAEGGEDAEAFTYSAITVLSPANDEAVRENAGSVRVVTGVEPELRSGHQIQILMDGQVTAAAGGSQVTLTEVDRGTHTLLVRVVDETGAILIESEPSTFHMLRYAPTMVPNRPKPTPRAH